MFGWELPCQTRKDQNKWDLIWQSHRKSLRFVWVPGSVGLVPSWNTTHFCFKFLARTWCSKSCCLLLFILQSRSQVWDN